MSRLVVLGLIIFALSAVAGASTITCSGAGVTNSSNCYGGTLSFATSTDSLNFYTAFGSAATGGSNPYNVVSNPIALVAENANGTGTVTVTLGPQGTGTMAGGLATFGDTSDIARFDNTEFVYDTNGTCEECASIGFTNQGSNGMPAALVYPGHFSAPTASSPGTSESDGAWGAFLLGPVNSSVSGSAASGEMVFTFSDPVTNVGFDISARGSSASDTNTNFIAEIDAYDASGNLLGYYKITADGSGGICATLDSYTSPQPCNDAPFIGIEGVGAISKIVIDAAELNSDSSLSQNGFFVGNMQFQDAPPAPTGEAPEPAALWICGGGMVLLSLAAKKLGKKKRANLVR